MAQWYVHQMQNKGFTPASRLRAHYTKEKRSPTKRAALALPDPLADGLKEH